MRSHVTSGVTAKGRPPGSALPQFPLGGAMETITVRSSRVSGLGEMIRITSGTQSVVRGSMPQCQMPSLPPERAGALKGAAWGRCYLSWHWRCVGCGVWELEVWHVRWEVGERPQTGGQGVVGCAPLPTGDHLRLNSFICERSW